MLARTCTRSVAACWSLLATHLLLVSSQLPQWSRLTFDGRADPFAAAGFGSALTGSSNTSNSALVMWRLGGEHVDQWGTSILSDLLATDTVRGWASVPQALPIPPPRTRMCMVSVPARVGLAGGPSATPPDSPVLVVFGGRFAIPSASPATYRDYNDVWAYDSGSGTWAQAHAGGNGAGVPGPRSAAACALRGDYLLVYGGVTLTGDLYYDTWAFHIPSSTWVPVNTAGPSPGPACAMAAVYVPWQVSEVSRPAGQPVMRGDALVLHGGRTYGNAALNPLATVLSDTYILALDPSGRPTQGGGGNTSNPAPVPAALRGVWYRGRQPPSEMGGSPCRAFTPAVLITGPPTAGPASAATTLALCMHGGADFVGYADRLVDDTVCADLGPSLTWVAIMGGAGGRMRELQVQPQPVPTVQPALVWWTLQTTGDRPTARQRHAAHLTATWPAPPVLLIHGGSYPGGTLADTWTLPIPALPQSVGSSVTSAGPWSRFSTPSDGSDGWSLSFIAYGGFGVMMVFLLVMVLVRRANERARMRALERAVAREMERDGARVRERAARAGGRTLDTTLAGLDPIIIDSLPTFVFEGEKEGKEQGADGGTASSRSSGSPSAMLPTGVVSTGGEWEGEVAGSAPASSSTPSSSSSSSSSVCQPSPAFAAPRRGSGRQRGATGTSLLAVVDGDHDGEARDSRQTQDGQGAALEMEAELGGRGTATATATAIGLSLRAVPGEPVPPPAPTSPIRPLSATLSSHTTCAICLTDYAAGDTCKMLPCLHTYHGPCLDSWLQGHTTCPLCKLDVALAARVA